VSGPGAVAAGEPVVSTISFPVPLPASLESTHVVFLRKTESTPTTGPCKGGTGNVPTADAGFLCVFTKEEEVIAGVKFTSEILGADGAKGALPTGAFLKFETSESNPESNIIASGSWAVTAP
jgi:hypothetical protein